jgi:hypothetical protein
MSVFVLSQNNQIICYYESDCFHARSNPIDSCLYNIYKFADSHNEPVCATENSIRFQLEKHIEHEQMLVHSIKSYHDLTHINVFERTMPTFFFITKTSPGNVPSYDEKILMIHVDM